MNLRWLADRRLMYLSSFILGGVFLWFCMHKIADPPDFAKAVNNYKLLPSEAVNAVAIFMPWLELLCGIALVTGVGRRGAAGISAGLMVAFIAALAFNLYRGHPTICGCSMTYEEAVNFTDEEKFHEMWFVIVRDVGLLILALQILWATCTCHVSRAARAKTAAA